MSKIKSEKRDKIGILAVITVVALMLLVTAGFVVLPFFGIYGLYEVLEELNLINVTTGDSFMGNITYFTFLIFVMYVITLILDLVSKIIIYKKKKKVAITRGSMLLNYGIQVVIAACLFKMLLDNLFSRIDLSLVGSFISFIIMYLIYFVLLDDYEIEQ
ncbi:hypothetical protein KQ939_00680 [Planococcus sp. CP5-4]|uniref:hypothetical protein n=1 Tax=unclassified Planococcus (in: firmicutes) TaxID=2662419 RepID=UPI001C21AFF6|nr:MULTISPECIES: hypothetical protein [unclassified Planococcus (in: firmicutes)]MBU9673382.1 hypothetical protein [Planococcus sp. CP5-4_YE]MBV0908155.1 hypothetical protein [Planococcus sp. CP5-4_UN]MBW6062216.1 hypothetical protein [Planococcus sp. CP5-4]